MKRKWGIWHYNSYYQRIARAVRETEGEVLVYRGELIDPVYHASCGGRGTEDAADVWGYQVPYLKGVPCPWHLFQENQVAVLNFSFQEFFDRLGIKEEALPAATGLGGLIEVLERTGSGRVKKLRVGGLILQGVALRKQLGLPSTDFSVQVASEKIVFSVRGRGHAVGLCQYGAQGLAMKGKNYREILTYYYQGVELRHLSMNFAE
jgi:stage II sporulation protein D